MSIPSFVTFTLFTLISLIGLVTLGNWQMERRQEKRVLIQKIEMRVKATPMDIKGVMDRRAVNGDIDYLRVRLAGVFDHASERYYFATFKGAMGWHVYTPLRLHDGKVVFINRGFVSDRLKSPETRKDGQITGETTVTGLVRSPGRKGYFDPDNDVAGNIWYWRDLTNMIASVYDKGEVFVYPFFVEAEAAPQVALAGEWPRGGVTRIAFVDNHFQYALTWYGLAIMVFAVYGFFFRNWLMQRGSA